MKIADAAHYTLLKFGKISHIKEIYNEIIKCDLWPSPRNDKTPKTPIQTLWTSMYEDDRFKRFNNPRDPSMWGLKNWKNSNNDEMTAVEKLHNFIIRNKNKSILKQKQSVQRSGDLIWKSAIKEIDNKCIITGIQKENMLVAAHIKPVAKFPLAEIARNENNGFIVMCNLHKPFDDGDWAIDQDGKIKISLNLSKQDVEELSKFGLKDEQPIIMDYKIFQKKYDYFSWHYNNIFRK